MRTLIKTYTYLLLFLAATTASAQPEQPEQKLTGTVIGTKYSVDYSTSRRSTTVNTCANAFDGDLKTYFASYDRSYTWTGLDLGRPCVITRVGWSPRDDSQGSKRVVLGLFEGANREDFMDALPLYIITEPATIGEMAYADVQCSAGFRYVRYIGPSDARCNIAELEFYGHEGEGDFSSLYQLTNLPTVTVHTQDNELPYDKEHNIPAILTIVAPESEGGLVSDEGSIRERGNGSRSFPKRPYRIKFDKKHRVLGSPAKAKKWTLINNYGDKTLLRNLLAFELSRRMGMPYTPFGRCVDVILNGEYKGCYQLCDQVTVNKHRVNIEEMTPQDTAEPELTGGYFVEIDAYAGEEPSMFYSTNWNPVTIKSPETDSIVAQQASYIENHFNKMERQVNRYLDFDTFLRHFLVGELSGNTDTYWSVFMYKHRENDTIYTGPVWDFDLAFENDDRTYPLTSKRDYTYRSGGSVAGNMRTFVDRIVISNTRAKRMMLDIWDQARHHGLNEENLIAFVDSLAEELQQAQQLNFTRWPILNQKVHQNPRTYGSYEGEVENVRKFLRHRVPWMDQKLGYTYEPDVEPDAILSADSPRQHIDFSRPYSIMTIDGRTIHTPLDNLPSGIYIVRQGQTKQKILLQTHSAHMQ